MKSVSFNNTVLRDGHQSLAATRMTLAQMLPVCNLLDSLNFSALETWGGATIDAGLRFLNEFPFDRLDALKKALPNTPHMMLLRGQNIVQYAHFADDVVEAFITVAAKHGMDVFRIFDALNDTRNMETAIRAVKKAKKHAQGVICYTTSPVHSMETFMKMAENIVNMECDSLCIKDMAGLIPPRVAFDLVSSIKKRFEIPVIVHTHETAGLGATTYYAAIEAGADSVDTSIAPFANGTGQPDTTRMLALLENHARKPDYDKETLHQIHILLKKTYNELSKFTSPENERIDNDVLTYQVPGGMLSNFRSQLKEQNMADRFDDVLKEIPVVRKALGWIPLVTPTSQIVGVQAMLNVKFGRWKNFSPQAIDIALGFYGQTPAPVDPEVKKIAMEFSGKDPINCRPADLKSPQMQSLRQELASKNLPQQDEHCVIYAMFPQEFEKHFQSKNPPPGSPPLPAPTPLSPAIAASKTKTLALTINGKQHLVTVQELGNS
ncbi:MAG: pyruvate carboxyltransferase [Verrucomicrobia bacterium GWC2_42_7]|nr:MAG: pyruvate carboxyltransferase [Verrucomicrobia bacterium GWC2_42_7]